MGTRKRYIIQTIEIRQQERHKAFEIKLPANVKKVTGVIITGALREREG